MIRYKMAKNDEHRSYCPVNLFTEVLGDKWSLLILRDMMFYKRRHFNELLRESEEKIASNILRDRLVMFEKEGLVSKGKPVDENHKQKLTYSLTEKSIDLLPLMVSAIGWSIRHEPVDKKKYKPAVDLYAAGRPAIAAFQAMLRQEHLGQATTQS